MCIAQDVGNSVEFSGLGLGAFRVSGFRVLGFRV